MAVPRPVLLALVGLALVASVFMVTRRGANESVSAPSKPATRQAQTAATPPAPATRKAQADAHKAALARKAKPAPAQRAHAKPAAPAARPAKPAAKSSVPSRVQAAATALGADKVVVFFFSKPGAADDVGARVAMRSLHGMSRVAIFDASLDELAAFRPMLSDIGISQIPATVIVRPGKKAVLIQGFVDAGTLRQNVADALR
jgi:hypothetical protein